MSRVTDPLLTHSAFENGFGASAGKKARARKLMPFKHFVEKRATGLEPATTSLEGWYSTN